MDKIDPQIEMLTQPLLTEEGFLNEACMNELSAFLNNMPRTYERCKDDPEWNTKRWLFWRDIVGALALWSIRNIGNDVNAPIHPPNLEKVLGFVGACLRPKFDKSGMAELSLCEINKMLFDILYDELDLFMRWNTEECMGKHWLDLDALLHNVCLSIRSERRENDLFDKKFKEDYPELA